MQSSVASAIRFYWVVTVTGGLVMALEILSARILAPHFGSSVYVWGSIISVFLAALSGGYLLGGKLADRDPRLSVLGRLILVASVFQLALLHTGDGLARWLAEATGYSPFGTLIAATFLFGPASLFLATVSPYAVRLATRELAGLGQTAGRLFALSTAGSLAGTLLATFALIPYLELSHSLAYVLLATTLTAGIALVGSDGSEKLAWVLVGLLTVAGVVELRTRFVPTQSVLLERVTPYQTLRVTEQKGIRYLRGNGVTQSAVKLDGSPVLPYVRVVPLTFLWERQPESLLIIGMGAGTVGTFMRQYVPTLQTDFVEIDRAVAEVATEYLHFRPGPNDRVHIADGRQFLERHPDSRWDLAYVDAYIGLSVPFQLTTLEFFELLKQRLNDGGLVMVNLAAGLEDPFSLAVYRTLAELFEQLVAFAVPGASNVALIATNQSADMQIDQLLARAREIDSQLELDPSLATLAAARIKREIDLSEAMLLRDAFAPANHLIRLGNAELPREIREQ